MAARHATDRPAPVALTPGAGDASLNGFTTRIFSHLSRVDQHRWAHAYVTALLQTRGKKSIRRLADSISPSSATAQSLRQFVNLSPWDWQPVLQALVRWAEGHGPVTAWSIGRVLLPKRGGQSVGVHRHFDPASGHTLNSQLGFGAFLCIGTTHVPVDWHLYLPRNWIDDPHLRRRSRTPDTECYRAPWVHVLDLVDALAETTASAPIVADMSHNSDARLLIHALSQRRHALVVAVPPGLEVIPFERGPGMTSSPLSARTCLASATIRGVVVTEPDGAMRSTRLLSAPILLPCHMGGPPALSPYQLFSECGPDNQSGTMWISTLPERDIADAASLTHLALSTTSAVTTMARSFGLLDFEGRSFPGWHHHMTLVSAAYAFRQLGQSRCRPSWSTLTHAQSAFA
jgi:hypothetical protein